MEFDWVSRFQNPQICEYTAQEHARNRSELEERVDELTEQLSRQVSCVCVCVCVSVFGCVHILHSAADSRAPAHGKHPHT